MKLEERHISKERETPLVSVITPAYNRASFLDETIMSVINQDYPNLEYIVLDDGSSDNTLDVIQKYENSLKWFSHENMGETKTVNKGISLSKGDIVAVVNSDDPLLPGAVSTAVGILLKHPDALAAYPDWREIAPDSRFIKEINLPDYDIQKMISTFHVGMGPGTFIRRKAFDLVGYRDEQFKYAGDLEFWFRLAMHGRLVHIPKVLATHRTHPDSLSVFSKGGDMAAELVRLAEKIFSYPELPPDIQTLRNKAYCIMHHTAVSFCGSDTTSKMKHHGAAFRYDPICYLLRVFVFKLFRRLFSRNVYQAFEPIYKKKGSLYRIRQRLYFRAGLL